MSGSSLVQQLDAQIDAFFSDWSLTSTALLLSFALVVFYPLFFGSEADAHPLLLARQAAAAPVRNSGESALYRSLEVPYGYPIRTGLAVKDAEAPKWSAGRDGDLRDVWRKAAEADQENKKILTVKGRDKPVEVSFREVSRQINVIGKHLKSQGAQRIAIFLPNSVEFLATLFAAAFYELTPILIPQKQSPEALVQLLKETKADALVALAGTIPPEQLKGKALKTTVWVVEHASQHLGFAQGLDTDNKNDSEWHTLVADHAAESSQLPASTTPSDKLPGIVSVWPGSSSSGNEIVEYSQANIIAAVAAQQAAFPRAHRITPTDLLLPLESLSHIYPLTITLAALYAQAALALTTAASTRTDYDLAFVGGLQPTLIIASAQTMARAHAARLKNATGLFVKLRRSRQASSLAAGSMIAANKALPGPYAGPRVIFIESRSSASARSSNDDDASSSSPLSAQDLNDLRILTGARLTYALSLPAVAGAAAQTHLFDYRTASATAGDRRASAERQSHFGPPLTCLEVKVVATERYAISDTGDGTEPGEIVLRGPAVVGGEARTGVVGWLGEDGTLRLV